MQIQTQLSPNQVEDLFIGKFERKNPTLKASNKLTNFVLNMREVSLYNFENLKER